MNNRDNSYLVYREEVLNRFDHKCVNCGSTEDLEIHHIVPLTLGGTNAITNLVPLCVNCHKAAHLGRNMTEYKKNTGRQKGGRKSKITFEEFDQAFEKYLNGEIGKRKLSDITGYSAYMCNSDSYPHYKRSLESRGISRLRNNIDVALSNGRCLHDGDPVGHIEYADGRKELIFYKDTGENDVEYSIRSNIVASRERKEEVETVVPVDLKRPHIYRSSIISKRPRSKTDVVASLINYQGPSYEERKAAYERKMGLAK